MSIKTSDELIEQSLTYLNAWRPDVDTSIGTLIKDVVIDVPATILGQAYSDLDQIQKASSINYADELTDNQLEDLAANWNLTRKQGSYATGVVTFIRYSAPTTTVTVGAQDGTGGVNVSTLKDDNGVSYSFTTVETKQFTVENADSLYNAERNRWELPITVQADGVGTDYNVAANAIKMFSGINGIDDIVNYNACEGGTDIETNTELAERIKLASKARLLGTIPGYETMVNAVEGVIDSKVVDTTSSDFIRNTYGNEVDIVVIGQQIQSCTDTVVFQTLTGMTYTLATQPVVSVNSITGTHNGQEYTFVEGTDYKYSSDTVSDYQGTTKAKDQIIWQETGNMPDIGSSYTINYSANYLITTLQKMIDLPENRLVGSDVLVRQATAVYVSMALSVATYSGTNPTSGTNQIKNVIQQYVNTLGLGDVLEQSDIVFQLREQLAFIDNITLPFMVFDLQGGTSSKNQLNPGSFKYFRINADDITVQIN